MDSNLHWSTRLSIRMLVGVIVFIMVVFLIGTVEQVVFHPVWADEWLSVMSVAIFEFMMGSLLYFKDDWPAWWL